MSDLAQTLNRIDGRGYKAYREILGAHPFARCTVIVDQVQADPFAAPSRLRAVVPWLVARLPASACATMARERAARDYIARALRSATVDAAAITIDAGAQAVLERTACLFTDAGIELRFRVQLPASGRRIRGCAARELLCATLPAVVARAVEPEWLDASALERHCAAVEDQVALRGALRERGLVAFLADGSVLPRRSGIDDRPLAGAVALEAPPSLRVTLEVPNAGSVTGLGILRGVTLIVGGGFHGKSTLLRAVESGVYDHIPDDGRERVVTDPDAVKIRAEDGRAVAGVDLSPFINDLPLGKPTRSFTTDLASGSTSQAAALQEALESGASALLVDEDTSATNFMIRDRRMQALVAKAHEPITPFVDRVGQLRTAFAISTLLVMGGSGDYFDRADHVIEMHAYQPRDVTAPAHRIAATHPGERLDEASGPFRRAAVRRLDARSLQPQTARGKRRIQARGRDTLVFGEGEIDLRAIEQLVEPAQVRAIGLLLGALAATGGCVADPPAALRDHLAAGFSALAGRPDGDLAEPRLHEAMAALNRLRGVSLDGS